MTARPWMPLYVGDYLADTGHLNATQHGAYLLLLMHCWQHGEIPINDDEKLARIARMDIGNWRRRCRGPILEFFDLGGRHGRIDREKTRAEEISNKRKAAAEQMHKKRRANAEQKHTQPQSQSQSHKKENNRGSRLPDDWQPSDADVKIASDHGLRLYEIEIEATKFRNYWTGKAGKDARKINWPRTWENWILNSKHGGQKNGSNRPRLSEIGYQIADEFGRREVGAGAQSETERPGSDQDSLGFDRPISEH